MRPICRKVRRELRRKKTTPERRSSGVSIETGEVSIWTTNAEPRSAPSMMASPAEPLIAPADINPANSIATAVELCKSMEAAAPVEAAAKRLLVERLSHRLRWSPNARSNPVRTRRTAQINRAAAAARFRTTRIGEFSIGQDPKTEMAHSTDQAAQRSRFRHEPCR